MDEIQQDMASQGCGYDHSGSRDVASVEVTAPLTPETFISAVAEIDFDEVNGADTLNYAAINTLHGRGSLDRETRRTVVKAIRTLQAIIRDANLLNDAAASKATGGEV